MIYGLIVRRKEFLNDLISVAYRAANLTAVVFFLVGCVGVFQFLLANKGWPQDIAYWVNDLGLSKGEFLAILSIVLLLMSMFLTGIAILVLTVPIVFPVATNMGVDPIHLGIIIALTVEMGSVIPPVGFEFVSRSAARLVFQCTVSCAAHFPFLCSDSLVLIAIIIFPTIPLWIPNMMAKNIFN